MSPFLPSRHVRIFLRALRGSQYLHILRNSQPKPFIPSSNPIYLRLQSPYNITNSSQSITPSRLPHRQTLNPKYPQLYDPLSKLSRYRSCHNIYTLVLASPRVFLPFNHSLVSFLGKVEQVDGKMALVLTIVVILIHGILRTPL